MKLVRFLHADRPVVARLLDDGRAERMAGEFPHFEPTGELLEVGPLLPPIVPTDLLCIGLNYRAHADEQGSIPPENPMLFIKSSNALAGPADAIVLPRESDKVDFEAELAVVMGRDAKHISETDALDYVFGYTCANDVSARDWQKDKPLNGGQFARGKSFDGFCPIGPHLVTADEISNPNALRIEMRVNGETLQSSSTGDMIFDVRQIIASLSRTMTIRAGSIILTGTPEGVGMARTPPRYLKAGDVCEVEIERVGTLTNRFVADD